MQCPQNHVQQDDRKPGMAAQGMAQGQVVDGTCTAGRHKGAMIMHRSVGHLKEFVSHLQLRQLLRYGLRNVSVSIVLVTELPKWVVTILNCRTRVSSSAHQLFDCWNSSLLHRGRKSLVTRARDQDTHQLGPRQKQSDLHAYLWKRSSHTTMKREPLHA